MSIIHESTKYNNERTDPEVMSVGDTFIGTLSAINDSDVIKIVFPERGWVKFELDIPSGTDYRIRVFKNNNSGNDDEAEDVRLGYLGSMRSCNAYVNNPSDIYYIVISVNYSNLVKPNDNYTLRVFYLVNESVTNYIEDKIDAFGITKSWAVGDSGNKYWNKGSIGTEDTLDGWGLTTSSTGTENVFGNARQCAGFSFFLAYKVFGDSINMINNIVSVPDNWKKITSNYTNLHLKPGDIVRKEGHSAMIYKTETNSNGDVYIHVIECLGSVSNLVRYGGYNGHTNAQTQDSLLSGSLEYVLIAPER